MGVDSQRQSIFERPLDYAKGITICIPAYNEEKTIERVVTEADLALKQIAIPGEILLIDDCSTDRTWVILGDLQKTLPVQIQEVDRQVFTIAGKSL